jgi:hypothetical protein
MGGVSKEQSVEAGMMLFDISREICINLLMG